MKRLRYAILLAVPLCEMVCGQIQGMASLGMGSMSLAQLYHGAMLCVVSYYLLSRLRQCTKRISAVEMSLAAFGAIAGVSTAVALRYNGHVREDIIAFSQVLYWILVWTIYVIECSTTEGRRLALTGVFVAGIYMAVSVVVLYAASGGAYSRYEEVDASFGGFSTAKSLGGILCVAGLLSLRVAPPRWRLLALCVSLAALMLTYQRAGQLAMGAALLWLVGKRMSPAIKERLMSPRSVLAFACMLVVAVQFVDTGALLERWENADVSLGAKAGSGRLGLWTDAVHAFEGMNWSRKVLGVGYSGMRDAMFEEGLGGNRKHTHSDVLDILLAFGVLGILGWIGIHGALICTVRGQPKASPEYAIGGAVYFVFFVKSLITGQMFGPATMIVYLGAITGLCAAERRPDARAEPCVAASHRYAYRQREQALPAWAGR